MRGGVDVSVGRPHRDAKRVADLTRTEYLVVPHESGQYGESRRVCRRPPLRASGVGVQVEKCAGSREPPAAVVKHIVEFVQEPPVAVDDEEVAVAAAAQIDGARV